MFIVDFVLKDKSIIKYCKIYKSFRKGQSPIIDKDKISSILNNGDNDYIMVQNDSLNATISRQRIANYWIHDTNTEVENLINEYIANEF